LIYGSVAFDPNSQSWIADITNIPGNDKRIGYWAEQQRSTFYTNWQNVTDIIAARSPVIQQATGGQGASSNAELTSAVAPIAALPSSGAGIALPFIVPSTGAVQPAYVQSGGSSDTLSSGMVSSASDASKGGSFRYDGGIDTQLH
jgi:hypothetical protein